MVDGFGILASASESHEPARGLGSERLEGQAGAEVGGSSSGSACWDERAITDVGDRELGAWPLNDSIEGEGDAAQAHIARNGSNLGSGVLIGESRGYRLRGTWKATACNGTGLDFIARGP